MGNFYVNFSVKGDDPRRIASALERAGCKAVITPPIDGYIIVFEEESDSQVTSAIERVGALLSREATAPVLGVLNHDDDILCYWLFEDGRLTDSYNSCPDYFGESDQETSGDGGDARRLCESLAAPHATDAVGAILRGDGYAFAAERHAELVEALGLPSCAVGLGYRYVGRVESPDGLDARPLIRVG